MGVHADTEARLAGPTQPLTVTGQRRPQTGPAEAGSGGGPRPVAEVTAAARGVTASVVEAADAGSAGRVLGVEELDLGAALASRRPDEVGGAGGVDGRAAAHGTALRAQLAVEEVLAPRVDAVQALVQTRLVHPQRHRHGHRRLQHQHHGHRRRHLQRQHCCYFCCCCRSVYLLFAFVVVAFSFSLVGLLT